VKQGPESEPHVPVTSSVPEELPAEQEALFREVLTIFEREKLPFAVAGAAALGIYGHLPLYQRPRHFSDLA